MEIIINNINICPYCLGIGKIKAMQSQTYIGGSVRAKDTEIKCSKCNGTGFKIN